MLATIYFMEFILGEIVLHIWMVVNGWALETQVTTRLLATGWACFTAPYYMGAATRLEISGLGPMLAGVAICTSAGVMAKGQLRIATTVYMFGTTAAVILAI